MWKELLIALVFIIVMNVLWELFIGYAVAAILVACAFIPEILSEKKYKG